MAVTTLIQTMKLKILLVVVVLLSGCSTQFGYNNLDWLVHWFIDDYVDLDRQQKKQFDEQMEVWLDWHRANELPRYAEQLREVQQQLIAGNVEAPVWFEHLNQVRQHWWRSRDKIGEIMVPLASELSDKQIGALFDALRERNEERREDRAELTMEEQREDRFEDLVEELEPWVGRLTDEQLALIKAYTSQHKSSFALRMDYQDRIQTAAREVMMQRETMPDFESRLLALIQNPEVYQGELSSVRETSRFKFSTLLANLNATLTAYQREYLQEEIQDLIDDIDELAVGGKPYTAITGSSSFRR